MRPLLNWNDSVNVRSPCHLRYYRECTAQSLDRQSCFDGVDGPYLTATFADDEVRVQLPLGMGYYGENLCASW